MLGYNIMKHYLVVKSKTYTFYYGNESLMQRRIGGYLTLNIPSTTSLRDKLLTASSPEILLFKSKEEAEEFIKNNTPSAEHIAFSGEFFSSYPIYEIEGSPQNGDTFSMEELTALVESKKVKAKVLFIGPVYCPEQPFSLLDINSKDSAIYPSMSFWSKSAAEFFPAVLLSYLIYHLAKNYTSETLAPPFFTLLLSLYLTRQLLPDPHTRFCNTVIAQVMQAYPELDKKATLEILRKDLYIQHHQVNKLEIKGNRLQIMESPSSSPVNSPENPSGVTRPTI